MTDKDKKEKSIKVHEAKLLQAQEQEMRFKELQLLEDMFDKIFRKEIVADFDTAGHLTNNSISGSKNFMKILLYIYGLEKKIAVDNQFNDDTRLKAIKIWYIAIKKLNNLSDIPVSESLNIIFGDKIVNLFQHRKHGDLDNLIRKYQNKIQQAIETVGAKATLDYLGCSISPIKKFFAKHNISWYITFLSDNAKAKSTIELISNKSEQLSAISLEELKKLLLSNPDLQKGLTEIKNDQIEALNS